MLPTRPITTPPSSSIPSKRTRPSQGSDSSAGSTTCSRWPATPIAAKSRTVRSISASGESRSPEDHQPGVARQGLDRGQARILLQRPDQALGEAVQGAAALIQGRAPSRAARCARRRAPRGSPPRAPAPPRAAACRAIPHPSGSASRARRRTRSRRSAPPPTRSRGHRAKRDFAVWRQSIDCALSPGWYWRNLPERVAAADPPPAVDPGDDRGRDAVGLDHELGDRGRGLLGAAAQRRPGAVGRDAEPV